MQNRSKYVIITLLLVLAAALLVYFYYFRDSKKRYQWRETYKAESKEPYGTYFIRHLLDGFRPGGKVIEHSKKNLTETLSDIKVKGQVNYVLIGGSLFLDDGEADSLVSFIRSGNDALIATQESPEFLLEKFFPYECGYKVSYLDESHDSVRYNFFHDSLRTDKGYEYAFHIGDRDYPYHWPYIGKGIFCDSTFSVVPLGFQSPSLANFIKIPIGNGNLYLHCSPIVFTNYFIARPEKAKYASAVFSHMRGNDFLWDERSKLPFINSNGDGPGPLYFILQQPALKYAWWLFIAVVLLYVLFAIKRTQRVIPVLEPKTNTSLEFIHQIALLHFDHGDHLDMARKKMKYFLYFIRSRYGIQHTQQFGDNQLQMLAEKARINLTDVKLIFTQYQLIEKSAEFGIPNYRLVDLFYAIDNFYKNCK